MRLSRAVRYVWSSDFKIAYLDVSGRFFQDLREAWKKTKKYHGLKWKRFLKRISYMEARRDFPPFFSPFSFSLFTDSYSYFSRSRKIYKKDGFVARGSRGYKQVVAYRRSDGSFRLEFRVWRCNGQNRKAFLFLLSLLFREVAVWVESFSAACVGGSFCPNPRGRYPPWGPNDSVSGAASPSNSLCGRMIFVENGDGWRTA